jgi:hypothetical protein
MFSAALRGFATQRSRKGFFGGGFAARTPIA